MALDFGSGALGGVSTNLLGAGLGLASQFANGGLAPGAQQGHVNQQTFIAPWMQQQWQNVFGQQNNAAGSAQVAGFTPAQLQAMQGIQGSVGYGMPALQTAQNNAQGFAGGIGPQQIQNFMSPFTQSAVQSTLNTMNQQRAQQDAAISGQASQQNAWGGDRSAVGQALNDQNWDLAEGQTISNLNNQGYQAAVNSALNNQYAGMAGNQQFQNAILNNIGANTAQYQNLLGVGNQQQAQNQNVANLPILRGQIMGQNLNPNTGSTTIGTNNYGTMQNPISGAIAGLQGGLQFGNQLSNLLGLGSNAYNMFNPTGGGGSSWGGPSANDVSGGNLDQMAASDPSSFFGFDPNQQMNLGNYDYGDPTQGLSFNAAGGEAANTGDQVASEPQSTDNSAYAGWSSGAPGGGSNFGIGSALGDASSAFNIYNGLQRGGFSGYAGAALSGAKLGSNLAGANIPGLGIAGAGLGLYNGLRSHTVSGDVGAALDAAHLLGGVGNLAGGTAAGGLGSLATIGAYAGPIGMALAPVLYGASKAPVELTGQYWNGMRSAINSGFSGASGNATYNANTTAGTRQQALNQELIGMILAGNNPMNGGAQLPADIQQYAQQNGLYQAASTLLKTSQNWQPGLPIGSGARQKPEQL